MKNTKVRNKNMMLFQCYITEDGKMYKNDVEVLENYTKIGV